MSYNELTHFNSSGDAYMVDVGAKEETVREGVADGRIFMEKSTLDRIIRGDNKKGDVLGIARVAGIMATKRTAELVPLCHPLMITNVNVELEPEPETNSVYCRATVRCKGQTGVEIEAVNAVLISLLTVYDMCKAVDRFMRITDVCMLSKSGGKSGSWKRED
ncbi:MAG: cyclic pyranopterin monophosphate synthase MoaC [Gammaproteobacteria bacterium]|nr:cyclic pyranopterin monophosphate synthase MoaC [Gammaproteobacteria bacterium]